MITSSVKILHGVNVQWLFFQNPYKICLLASGVTYSKWKTKEIVYPYFPWVSWLTTCSSSATVQECFTTEGFTETRAQISPLLSNNDSEACLLKPRHNLHTRADSSSLDNLLFTVHCSDLGNTMLLMVFLLFLEVIMDENSFFYTFWIKCMFYFLQYKMLLP